jgi:hypothetical protein
MAFPALARFVRWARGTGTRPRRRGLGQGGQICSRMRLTSAGCGGGGAEERPARGQVFANISFWQDGRGMWRRRRRQRRRRTRPAPLRRIAMLRMRACRATTQTSFAFFAQLEVGEICIGDDKQEENSHPQAPSSGRIRKPKHGPLLVAVLARMPPYPTTAKQLIASH